MSTTLKKIYLIERKDSQGLLIRKDGKIMYQVKRVFPDVLILVVVKLFPYITYYNNTSNYRILHQLVIYKQTVE